MLITGISGRLVPRFVPQFQRSSARRFGFELLAMAFVITFFVIFAWGMAEMSAPIGKLQQEPISLAPHHLWNYALRTTLRMLIAVVASFIFTLIYATLAAKSRRAGQILVPLLDILQSVPVLGYISFTVTGFLALFPGSMLGPECAAIFAIFTSQAWNMTFSLYQSLLTIPRDMEEASFVFKLSGWQKFWKMELPYAMPSLIWNMMMSMSGGWFFVTVSEAITVGNEHIMLPGIGSYIAVAIEQRDLHAIFYAIGTMVIVILLYDQFLFRPLVAWADKFRYEMTASGQVPRSWVLKLFVGSRIAGKLAIPFRTLSHFILRIRLFRPTLNFIPFANARARLFDYVWYVLLSAVGLIAVFHIFVFLKTSVDLHDVVHVIWLGMLTLTRVILLIIVASLIWVPIGVYIGRRPHLTQIMQPLAQFLAAFPANLLFPLAVVLISRYQANPNIWLSPLLILGTQWYILFNVIAGAAAFPNDLEEAARNFGIKGWMWWKKVMLPGIFPYFLTGAITASGGAWNASIVAEAVSWGDKSYTAEGLGSYIAEMTAAGDFAHIALGIGVMSTIVVIFNKGFWRPLYNIAAKKLRFD